MQAKDVEYGSQFIYFIGDKMYNCIRLNNNVCSDIREDEIPYLNIDSSYTISFIHYNQEVYA